VDIIKVELTFEEDETGPAGFPYGEAVFNEQVKDKINYEKNILLVFPKHIEIIASSFVQGFFAELKRRLGIGGIVEKFKLDTSSQWLTDSVIANLR
jgi:hypothetical protein